MAELLQVCSQHVGLVLRLWRRVHRIEREADVARQREQVDGQRVQRAVGVSHRRRLVQFREALQDKQDAVDEQAVGAALDFEVAEERVGAEQVEGFLDDVVLLVGRVCRPPVLGVDGEQHEVADGLGRPLQGVERRVVRGHGDLVGAPTDKSARFVAASDMIYN